jgi:hypothetical protein
MEKSLDSMAFSRRKSAEFKFHSVLRHYLKGWTWRPIDNLETMPGCPTWFDWVFCCCLYELIGFDIAF